MGLSFSPAAIIRHKRDGETLSPEEINAFVSGVVDGTFADYQASALLMAIWLNGMEAEETAALTQAMRTSGEVLDLPSSGRPRFDKHSTGGVGDKVSLVLAPLVTACGLAVPMISGRGLGHTGGTLDKLEAIPGYQVFLDEPHLRRQLEEVGCFIAGQTPRLVPADRTLYALRDVTATVESIPLICASILSKKLAAGLDGLVLDVKYGSGAFFPHPAKARALADALVATARSCGLATMALLTSMEEPLGRTAGNAPEVAEAVACLEGKGPEDTMAVTMALATQMLLRAGIVRIAEEADDLLTRALFRGEAREVFNRMVAAQGGDTTALQNGAAGLPQAKCTREILHTGEEGYIFAVEARLVGEATLALGAGRRRKEDDVDLAAGISQLVKRSQFIRAGERLGTLHASTEGALDAGESLLRQAIQVTAEAPPRRPLMAEVVG